MRAKSAWKILGASCRGIASNSYRGAAGHRLHFSHRQSPSSPLDKTDVGVFIAADVPVFALPSVFDGLNGSTDNRDLEGIWFADAPWLLENAA